MTASSPSKIARFLTQAIENIESIEGYVAGLDESAFVADRKTVDPVERCLQRVIEALGRIKKKGGEQLLPDLPLHCALGHEMFATAIGRVAAVEAERRIEAALEAGEGLDASLILLALHASIMHPGVSETYQLESG